MKIIIVGIQIQKMRTLDILFNYSTMKRMCKNFLRKLLIESNNKIDLATSSSSGHSNNVQGSVLSNTFLNVLFNVAFR